MTAKKLISELKKIIKQYDRVSLGEDIDVNILIDRDSVKELKKVSYNPRYGGDGIILE